MSGEHEEIYKRLNRLETAMASHSAEVRTEVAKIRDDVQELLRVVVRGNGDSLVTRLRIVERDLASRFAVAQEGVRGRWSAIVALIGAAGMVGAGIAAIVVRALYAGGGS